MIRIDKERMAVFALAAICAVASVSVRAEESTSRPRPAVPSPERLTWSRWWCPPGAWKARVDYKLDEIRKGPGQYDIVFVGDSVTQNWEGWLTDAQRENLRTNVAAGRISLECAHIEPKKAWLRLTSQYRALNLGISGDRTQDMLWRLTVGGHLDGYKSRYFCVLAGANNTADSPEDTAAGVREIVTLIRRRHPESKILLMAILPHGEKRDAPVRRRNEAVNRLISGLADGDKVIWVDIRDKLLEPDGTLSRKMMPDFLHPLERGYEIWLEAITPYLKKIRQNAEPGK